MQLLRPINLVCVLENDAARNELWSDITPKTFGAALLSIPGENETNVNSKKASRSFYHSVLNLDGTLSLYLGNGANSEGSISRFEL